MFRCSKAAFRAVRSGPRFPVGAANVESFVPFLQKLAEIGHHASDALRSLPVEWQGQTGTFAELQESRELRACKVLPHVTARRCRTHRTTQDHNTLESQWERSRSERPGVAETVEALCTKRRDEMSDDGQLEAASSEGTTVCANVPVLEARGVGRKAAGCVFELVDRAGQRVFVGTAASMEAAVVPTSVQKFAGGGCEVRKVREVEGGRDALLAAKAAVVQESVASGCPLLNYRVKCGPILYEVVDEAECRVYVGVSRNMYKTNHDLQQRGVLCDGRVVRKVRDVPVGMSAAEAKADLIAESVASGCRLLNTRRQRGKEKQAGCVFELVDRAGQRVFVGTAASMEAAVVPTLVQKLAGGGCEVRKVREVEGGRDALLAAKTAVVQESVASGCSLLNYRVKCGPFLYEVVDEAECRVYVGVSRNMYGTNHVLQRSGVLCDGRVVRKVRNVPVGMSAAEAKADLIAESVASGCRLLNTQRQRGKEKQAGCVFELVDRAGQRVYVGKAASMEAAVVPTSVQKFAGGGCEVRKVREVEGGRDALLAAKAAVVQESVASGCLLLNDRVKCGPFLYEVVDEAECRVFVGVSRNMYKTNRDLRRSGVLCDGRVVRKVRNVPVGMSAAEAKADLIAESVASGCFVENAAVVRFDGESDVAASLRFMSRPCDPQSCPDAFHSKHAATLARHRVGPCPTTRDEGVVYALYDDSLSVVYVGQTQFSAVRRAKTHVRDALRTDRKRKTRLHAAMLRHGKPFHVAPLEKIDVRLSRHRTFREIALERERHYISVLKPTLNMQHRPFEQTWLASCSR